MRSNSFKNSCKKKRQNMSFSTKTPFIQLAEVKSYIFQFWGYHVLFFKIIILVDLSHNISRVFLMVFVLFIQGNSRFGRCRLSCLLHYIHYYLFPCAQTSKTTSPEPFSLITLDIPFLSVSSFSSTVWKSFLIFFSSLF